MKCIAVLVAFISVVVCHNFTEWSWNEDKFSCEDEINRMDFFCPKGNRCMTRIRELIACAMDQLTDIISIIHHKNLTHEVDAKLDELEKSMSQKILKLEEVISSFKRQMESKKINYSDPPDTKNSEKRNTSRTSLEESPCMYILREGNYFLTPHMGFREAKQCCHEYGSKPFVPKTQDEYVTTVVKITSGVRFGWLPIHNFGQNGNPVWDDETSLYDSSLRVRFTMKPSFSLPENDSNCVGVSSTGTAYWLSCNALMRMLCIQI